MRNENYEKNFKEFCEERKLSPGVAKVYRSNIKGLIEDSGKTFNSAVGLELTDPTSLGLYFDKAARRYGEKNLYAIKNKINAFKDFVIKKSFDSKLPSGNFSATLSFLLKEHGISINKLSGILSISERTLGRWVHGDCLLDYAHLQDVASIEQHFNLPAGTLVMRLGPCVLGQKKFILDNKKTTDFGEKSKRLMKRLYHFPYDKWPQKVKDDLEKIRKIYSSDQAVVDGVVKSAKQKWKISKTGKQSSYERLKSSCERLFGFMLLSKDNPDPLLCGLGLAINEVSITALFNASIYGKFMDFYANRQAVEDEHGNWVPKYSNELKHDLNRIKALINTTQGFIPQMPYLASDCFQLLPSGEIKKEFAEDDSDINNKWAIYCNLAFHAICKLKNGTRFSKTRDTKEGISALIDSEDIFEEIRKYTKAIEVQTHRPGLPAFKRAVLYRDFLICLFHLIFVFRSDHYSVMRLGRDLKKRENGLWRLHIYEKDFKPADSNSMECSTLDLPQDISKFIDVYVKIHRPFLKNPESDYFFLPSTNSGHSEDDPNYLLPRSISRIVNHSTLIHTESETGFSSHAIRNLTSTACYQEAWDAFAQGAGLLGHTVEVNKKHYTFKTMIIRLRGHITILQNKGILEMPKEILEAKKKEKDQLQEMKAENEKLKKMLEMALSFSKKTGDNHESL